MGSWKTAAKKTTTAKATKATTSKPVVAKKKVTKPGAAQTVEVQPETTPPTEVQPEAAKPEAAQPKAKAAKVKPAKKTDGKMSALDAAAKVLGEANAPMTTKEMIEAMAAKGYWTSKNGQTPAATLYSAILREVTTKGAESRFQKTDRGHFALSTVAKTEPTPEPTTK